MRDLSVEDDSTCLQAILDPVGHTTFGITTKIYLMFSTLRH